MSASSLSSMRRALPGLSRAIASWRDQARQRVALRELDDRTLRDLGFHRSEWQSYLAECSRDAEPTRRRVAPRLPAPPRPAPRDWRPRSAGAAWASVVATLLAGVSLGGWGAGDAGVGGVVATDPPARSARGEDPVAAVYLPSQFPPPEGLIEPLPAQF